jgi:hypothetical protein
MKAELDIELMKKLYEFGGLLAYKVIYFDSVVFKVVTHCITFDESYAKNQQEMLQLAGHTVGREELMVKFDNAFLKKETNETTA